MIIWVIRGKCQLRSNPTYFEDVFQCLAQANDTFCAQRTKMVRMQNADNSGLDQPALQRRLI